MHSEQTGNTVCLVYNMTYLCKIIYRIRWLFDKLLYNNIWYNSADEYESEINICYTSFPVGDRWSKITVWRNCIWWDQPKEKCRHEEVWQTQGTSWAAFNIVVASLEVRGAFKIVACFLRHGNSKVCLQVHFRFIWLSLHEKFTITEIN